MMIYWDKSDTLWELALSKVDTHLVVMFFKPSLALSVVASVLNIPDVYHTMLLYKPDGHNLPLLEGTTGVGIELTVVGAYRDTTLLGIAILDLPPPQVIYLHGCRACVTRAPVLWETYAKMYGPCNPIVRYLLRWFPPGDNEMTCCGYILHRVLGYNHLACRNVTHYTLLQTLEEYEHALSEHH